MHTNKTSQTKAILLAQKFNTDKTANKLKAKHKQIGKHPTMTGLLHKKSAKYKLELTPKKKTHNYITTPNKKPNL